MGFGGVVEAQAMLLKSDAGHTVILILISTWIWIWT
jgi:hypothetical protein